MIGLSEVEGELQTRLGVSSDTELSSYVHSACNYYSRFNPNIVEDTLDLVSGQQVYDLPSGVFSVRRIDWWPFGEKQYAGDLLLHPEILLHDDSKYIFKQVKTMDLYRCRWMIEADQLILFPVPQEDKTVDIVYCAYHQFSASGSVYETIPDEDLYLIVGLAMAEYLETQQAQSAMLPDFSEGMTTITRRYMVRNLSSVIDRLREQVRLKYSM